MITDAHQMEFKLDKTKLDQKKDLVYLNNCCQITGMSSFMMDKRRKYFISDFLFGILLITGGVMFAFFWVVILSPDKPDTAEPVNPAICVTLPLLPYMFFVGYSLLKRAYLIKSKCTYRYLDNLYKDLLEKGKVFDAIVSDIDKRLYYPYHKIVFAFVDDHEHKSAGSYLYNREHDFEIGGHVGILKFDKFNILL